MKDTLSTTQIDHFIHQGFVRVHHAFSADIAKEVRDILWNDLALDRHDRSTWTQPVVRLGIYTQEPFLHSANSPLLHRAFDQLVGENNWSHPHNMGTFPIRFPSEKDAGDTGWHVDASFPGIDPLNYLDWRINYRSRGRGLLMLFLFSDVGEDDAPTRIRTGSHLDVARVLAARGEEGLSFMELAGALDTLPVRDEVIATGPAGTVYLCHPFIVHAAQPHRGQNPKFMAQPPLLLKNELSIDGDSPVERAIRLGISQ
jgi:hypothetical protein